MTKAVNFLYPITQMRGNSTKGILTMNRYYASNKMDSFGPRHGPRDVLSNVNKNPQPQNWTLKPNSLKSSRFRTKLNQDLSEHVPVSYNQGTYSFFTFKFQNFCRPFPHKFQDPIAKCPRTLHLSQFWRLNGLFVQIQIKSHHTAWIFANTINEDRTP